MPEDEMTRDEYVEKVRRDFIQLGVTDQRLVRMLKLSIESAWIRGEIAGRRAATDDALKIIKET